MKSIKEIKNLAREMLHGKFTSYVILFLSAYVIQNVIVSIPSTILASPKNVLLYCSQILLTVLLESLGAMIMLGMYRGALHLVRNEKFGIRDLFYAFRNQADHFLELELILTAINTVTSIPMYVFVWICPESMNFLKYSVICLLFSVLSTILTFLITLVFSMSEFLMLDDPSLTAIEAMRTSVYLMKGHIGQYFLLILSFLGLILLGFTSVMIGFIWVVPYMVISQAIFYENLCDLNDAEYQTYE